MDEAHFLCECGKVDRAADDEAYMALAQDPRYDGVNVRVINLKCIHRIPKRLTVMLEESSMVLIRIEISKLEESHDI
jgi:hypothetical protein